MIRSAVLVLCAVVMTAAFAQAPAPDMNNPAAVGRAYLDACERWDFDAGNKLAASHAAFAEAQRILKGGWGCVDPEPTFKELLCLPVMQHTKYVAGDPAIKGDECRIPVVATYTMPQTLVLRKQPDGTWKVDVHETILSTTGAAEALFVRAGEPELQGDCLSNLKQLCLAMLQYAQDHDETFPHADKWCDELMGYMKNEQVLKCPAAPELECGYAFNVALSGKPLATIAEPAQTIILFDSDQGKRNGSAAVTAIPKPGRHNVGNNVGYVDGHVKWLKAD